MSVSEEPISFAVRGEHQNGIVRLFASGELDISTAPLLEQWLGTVERLRPTTIIVDFADLRFMDSTGLKMLLQAHQLATGSGRAFLVVNGREGVRRVFELTRTEHLVDSSSLPSLLGTSTGDGNGEWSPITMPGPDGG